VAEFADCRSFFDTLSGFSRVLALKIYRLRIDPQPPVPILPCLDHEARLHQTGIAPHAAAYIEDKSGNLHEIVIIPDDRRVEIDVVSTLGECTPESRDRLVETLTGLFPGYAIKVVAPPRFTGLRVANACRAQVTLRDVLLSADLDRTKTSVDRLQTISQLMEKESRVASWGARTVMTPIVALVGFLSYQILGLEVTRLGPDTVGLLRYLIVGVVGGAFLYYGIKAVELTQMSNRVWKRSAEYGLILNERRKLDQELRK
jgi:hypothetical protein